jgi:cell division protease FtsH
MDAQHAAAPVIAIAGDVPPNAHPVLSSSATDNPTRLDKAVPPSPMPRDKQGWRVAPAPDGRGTPDEHRPTPPHRLRGFWLFMVTLLAVNWVSVLIFKPGAMPRVEVPFSPFFLQQLEAGKVKSISSMGDTIDGTFVVKLRYPATDAKTVPTTLFTTQVPAFWNHDQLSAELQAARVQVNAKSTTTGTSLLAEILLGFGPTLLFVGLFVVLGRRAAGGAGGGLGGARQFRALAGASRRPAEDPRHLRRCRRD